MAGYYYYDPRFYSPAEYKLISLDEVTSQQWPFFVNWFEISLALVRNVCIDSREGEVVFVFARELHLNGV